MEVNNNASLLSQITAQSLGGGASRATDKQISPFDPQPGQKPEAKPDRNTDSGSSRPPQALVKIRGGRSAEELGLSSQGDLDDAQQRVARLTDREAPLGRISDITATEVPLGQIVDIRV